MTHVHCQLCGAHFELQTELDQHKSSCHHQQDSHSADAHQADAKREAESRKSPQQRKDHEFTRRHME